MPTPCPLPDELAAFALGTLPIESSEAIAEHLDRCPNCEATFDGLEGSADTLVEHLRAPQVPDDVDLKSLLERAAALVVATERPAPVVLKQLRDYQLLEVLGHGGMGAVYRAIHVHLERIVAVKVLPPDRTRDPHAIARFRREMRAVGKLHHPNIVVAHDAGEADGTHFLVMELVDGADASRLVHAIGPLPVANAAEIVRQAAAGLQHAHEHGLVHRDIKPSNLIVTRAGEVKVLDLGLALLAGPQAAGDELTGESQMMGTADYMAPEQTGNSHGVDIRADIYSLGCTFYKLLTGTAPFSGPGCTSAIQKMMAHVGTPAPDVRALRPDVPADLAAIVAKMLAKQPADRYATPAEAELALAPHCHGAKLAGLADRANRAEPDAPAESPIQVAAATQATDATSTFSQRTPENVVVASCPLELPFAIEVTKHKVASTNPPRRRNWAITGFAASLVLVLAGAGIFRVQTADGTLVLTVDDPNVTVMVDGQKALVKPGADGKTLEISVDPGDHKLVVKTADGVQLKVDDRFTISAGGKTQLTAVLERSKPPVVIPASPPVTLPKNPADPDRAVAEWVLSKGGTVSFAPQKGPLQSAQKLAELPAEPFVLRTIGLNNCQFHSQDEVAVFSLLPAINRHDLQVYLGDSNIGDQGLAHVVECQDITALFFGPTNKVTDNGLAALSRHPRLVHVGLPPGTTDAGLKHLAGLPNLERLGAIGTQVTDAGLLELRGLSKLTHVSVGRTSVTLPGVAAAFGDCELQSLDVDVDRESDLELVKQWPRLGYFFTGRNPDIGDAGLAHLATLVELRLLHASYAKVTDAGVAPLANLKKLYQLQLSGATIGDGALATFGQMPQLRQLWISNTRVTDAGLQELAELTDLESLTLLNTRTTQAGIDSLRAKLPKCKIEWSPAKEN